MTAARLSEDPQQPHCFSPIGRLSPLGRREFLAGLCSACLAPGTLSAGSDPFKLCICNEIFQGCSFSKMCEAARRHGYAGLEVAPFTLSQDPAALSAQERWHLKKTMQDTDVRFVGLHWLLSAPSGLHVTTPDDTVRKRSWEFFRRLIDVCADLGDGGVMVFGSGKQRGTTAGASVQEATVRLKDGLSEVAPLAEARGVTILLEPLAPHLCDVITSLSQTLSMVKEIGSPAVQTMFDTHNAVAEKASHDELIRIHRDHIRHVHVNEMDGGHPGTGSYDFKPVLKALKEIRYQGWISVEVFDFSPGQDRIALESYQYLRRVESQIRSLGQSQLRERAK